MEKFLIKLKETKYRRQVRVIFLLSLLFLFLFSLLSDVNVKEDMEYTDYEHIALYVIKYREFPENYIPKSSSGSVVGEDLYLYETFRNDEGLLPSGYTYTSLYIDSTKSDISAIRIVYSEEAVYLTEDHYLSFDEINRFDILGIHYIVVSMFWIVLISSNSLLVLSVRRNVFTLNDLKEDVNEDYQIIRKWIVDKWNNLRDKIENN